MADPIAAGAVQRPGPAIADKIGPEAATALTRAGLSAIRAAYGTRSDLVHPGIAEHMVATVLLAAINADAEIITRAFGEGILEGALLGIREAELNAVADTIRVAYRVARADREQPLRALLELADRLGVDLTGDMPADPSDAEADEVFHLADVISRARLSGIHAGGYTLARAILEAGYTRKVAA